MKLDRPPCSLTVLFFLAAAGPLAAQPVTVTEVRCGFPNADKAAGDRSNLFKLGRWTPVFVRLTAEEAIEGPLTVTVAADDASGLTQRYAVPVTGVFQKGEAIALTAAMPYIRPGNDTLRVSVEKGGRAASRDSRQNTNGLYADAFLALTAGPAVPEAEPADATGENFGLALVTDPADLPDRWFGYDCIDLVILPTGRDRGAFLRQLFGRREFASRAAALAEWVRRGGRLVVSTSGPDRLPAGGLLGGMLPVEVGDTVTEERVSLKWRELKTPAQHNQVLRPDEGRVRLAGLRAKAGRPSHDLTIRRAGNRPLVRTGGYGSGQVTVVAFDLDGPGFLQGVSGGERAAFYRWLYGAASRTLDERPEGFRGPRTFRPDGFGGTLSDHLDKFAGVPVVSFGWVALFIIGYIILIGPVEYLVLKRVFKRLELTWITFPVIVITISAAAYFTAYALKGRDLKVNKVDLIDIDLNTQRAYGRSWFTVFSPRIDDYQVSVTPAGEGWGDAGEPGAGTAVSWFGGTGAGRSPFFSRDYEYAVRPEAGVYAGGLKGVPIQVWSTKSFAAEWGTGTKGKPLFEADLGHPAADPSQLTGTVTSNLPVKVIRDVRLFYRGKVYGPFELIRGRPRTVPTRSDAEADKYLQRLTQGDQFRLERRLFGAAATRNLGDAAGRPGRLDQSWRLSKSNDNEAILLARLPLVEGPIEEITAADGTPTRLWLKNLPGQGARLPLPGTLRQETYIRVFIPVRPAGNQP